MIDFIYVFISIAAIVFGAITTILMMFALWDFIHGNCKVIYLVAFALGMTLFFSISVYVSGLRGLDIEGIKCRPIVYQESLR